MKTAPLVSVVMSVYNGEKYLRESIESILNQTFTDFEFIILDDGSVDDTKNIIKNYKDDRIVLISHENQGLVSSLNKGIKMAKGKYIARQDADDISMTNRLQKQVEHLERYPETELLGTCFRYIDEQSKTTGASVILPTRSLDLKARMLFSNAFGHGTTMFSKSVFNQVGGYREKYGANEDFDLWRRIAYGYTIANLPDILYSYRVNPEGIISNVGISYKNDFESIIKENWTDILDERTYVYLLKGAVLYRFLIGIDSEERYNTYLSDQWHILAVMTKLRKKKQIVVIASFLMIVQPIKFCRFITSKLRKHIARND